MPKDIKWENQTDAQRIQQLRNELDDTLLALRNLMHDVGRLAARQTATELSLKALVETSRGSSRKVLKKK